MINRHILKYNYVTFYIPVSNLVIFEQFKSDVLRHIKIVHTGHLSIILVTFQSYAFQRFKNDGTNNFFRKFGSSVVREYT